MAIFDKKSEFSKYSREELERMRDECISKLNATAGSYREPDSFASTIKESGTYGLRMMSRPQNDRRYWQNRLDAIDLAIKEQESPKKKAEEFKKAEAELLIETEDHPNDESVADKLQDLRLERYLWLCELAGFLNCISVTDEKMAEADPLISSAETAMTASAEHYANLTRLIDQASKNPKVYVPNYDRLVDDYGQLEALATMTVSKRLKELENFKKRNEKITAKTQKDKTSSTRNQTTPKGMRRKSERLENLIDTKDYGVGSLGE